MLFKRSVIVVALTALSAHANISTPQSFAPRRVVAEGKRLEVTTGRGGAILDADKKAMAGAAGFVLMDSAMRKFFRSNGITFPSQLAGCIVLLTAMIVGDSVAAGSGMKVFELLAPGAALLTKWCVVVSRNSGLADLALLELH